MSSSKPIVVKVVSTALGISSKGHNVVVFNLIDATKTAHTANLLCSNKRYVKGAHAGETFLDVTLERCAEFGGIAGDIKSLVKAVTAGKFVGMKGNVVYRDDEESGMAPIANWYFPNEPIGGTKTVEADEWASNLEKSFDADDDVKPAKTGKKPVDVDMEF